MPSASSWMAARTMSATLRLWPRCTTSAPCACSSRRITLIAASCPSNSDAADTKRTGVVRGGESGWRRTAVPLSCLAFMGWGEQNLLVSRILGYHLGYHRNLPHFPVRDPTEVMTRTARSPRTAPAGADPSSATTPLPQRHGEDSASAWRAGRKRLRDHGVKRDAVVR